MSRFRLGPSIDTWNEPTTPETPTSPGFQGIVFTDTPIEPGGKVNFKLAEPQSGDFIPMGVKAVYVPLANLPPSEQQTAEWFLGSGYPSGNVNVFATADPFSLVVSPAPEAGLGYKVQTVIEYPDA